ncbi:hypothetical protein Hanom_Chr00s002422g01699731 [Helianthus anomalus]
MVFVSFSSRGNTTRYDSFLYLPSCSMYLKRFKCMTKIWGGFLIFILFCASCKL